MFRKIKKFFIDFFGNIKVYKGGLVLFGGSSYGLKGPDWRKVLDVIKPGDIVLNAHNHYVSSWFIKGNFGHVGLYVGNDKIIHVVTDGITKEDILTFLRADAAAVVRIKDRSKVDLAIQRANEQLNKHVEYDYDFDKKDTTQFYCSEFTDFCYGYPLRDGISLGKSFILPDDYLSAHEDFDIVWVKK